MDKENPYDRTISILDAITKEGGWYVYCYEEEEWHLYNEDGELLRRAHRIEDLIPPEPKEEPSEDQHSD